MLAELAFGAPLSAGAWVSEPTAIDGPYVYDVGSSPAAGWLLTSWNGDGLQAQRVAPDGVLVDATPIELTPDFAQLTVLWTTRRSWS